MIIFIITVWMAFNVENDLPPMCLRCLRQALLNLSSKSMQVLQKSERRLSLTALEDLVRDSIIDFGWTLVPRSILTLITPTVFVNFTQVFSNVSQIFDTMELNWKLVKQIDTRIQLCTSIINSYVPSINMRLDQCGRTAKWLVFCCARS